ncbi:MAG: hypothetical protein F6K30_26555 [Cyanothece sp. SIO2G6]|nr:hypothetical protein [Cyanothece sp. SIO2G6]
MSNLHAGVQRKAVEAIWRFLSRLDESDAKIASDPTDLQKEQVKQRMASRLAYSRFGPISNSSPMNKGLLQKHFGDLEVSNQADCERTSQPHCSPEQRSPTAPTQGSEGDPEISPEAKLNDFFDICLTNDNEGDIE